MINLEFSYDIAGHDDIELNLISGTHLTEQVLSYIYTKNSGPLTFSYDIAGNHNETNHQYCVTQVNLVSNRNIVAVSEIFNQTVLNISRIWDIRETNHLTSSTLMDALHLLNIGYTDDVMFGSVILRHAQYDAIDEVDFPFREKRLYGGYRSIRSTNIRGYSGAFVAVTNDWNDIQDLMDLIGQPKTLRIWGKPYRNCYIKPPIKVKTIKKGVNRWEYWVSIYQDSAIVEVSA
mgnify:FL=1